MGVGVEMLRVKVNQQCRCESVRLTADLCRFVLLTTLSKVYLA